jgi:predicted site-specific integrase-resolvase
MAKQAAEQQYYQTTEACEMVGISRMTFLRWVRLGLFPDVENRDWKGWRQFTEADIARLRKKVNESEREGVTRI